MIGCNNHNKNRGFTIIELMIATVVFSIVLLICIQGMVQISRAYYKGISHTRTQEAARNIMDEVTNAIRLSGSNVEVVNSPQPGPNISANSNSDDLNGLGVFCAGNKKYTYILDRKVVDDPASESEQKVIKHALVSEDAVCANGVSANIDDLNTDSVDRESLLGSNMRLTKFNIQPVLPVDPITTKAGSQLWKIEISIAYGDQDLLAVGNDGVTYTDDFGQNRVICAAGTGDEFCSTVELSTIVSRRIGS